MQHDAERAPGTQQKRDLSAALEEFGTYGYDKVNMERICGNHGISKGMMYHYYSNKTC